MDRRTTQKLRVEFDKQLRERLPQFQPLDEDEAHRFGRVYRSDRSTSVYVFLLLLASQRDNSFTIEVAWSKREIYPLATPLKTPIDMPQFELQRDYPSDGTFRFRLASLFHLKGDYWWHASNQSELSGWNLDFLADAPSGCGNVSLATSVRQSVDAIVRHGMLYVEENVAKSSPNA